ncbi:hypothetical protein [Actinomadura sp. K4S16]|uniref:hypothetical protein n=1 Tax=Actinomadura sp. K4S16 TaxID=1316147 RepID=UPI0011EBE22B|nr:hypothetical protein [Actinomadura sp. K4S16]
MTSTTPGTGPGGAAARHRLYAVRHDESITDIVLHQSPALPDVTLLSLADEADAPAVIAMLEDAYQRGAAHAPCDRAAEVRAIGDDAPDGHAYYVVLGTIRRRIARLDQDGDTTVLNADEAPLGLTLDALQPALIICYQLALRHAETSVTATAEEAR